MFSSRSLTIDYAILCGGKYLHNRFIGRQYRVR